jgi:hypothetical protein
MSKKSVTFQVGEAIVARTEDEGCDVCGGKPMGVLVPKADDPDGAYRDGVLVCEDCYDSEDHYDDNEMFGFKELTGSQ